MSALAGHHGLLMRRGGGGAGLPPTTYAGLTIWLDMSDAATVWADTAGTTAASPAGPISRVDSKGASRCIAGNAATAYYPGADAHIKLRPENAFLTYYNHRPAGVAPTTFAALSQLRTASTMTAIYAIRINDGNPDAGAAYFNDSLLYDASGYLFISTYRDGSNGVLDCYQEVSGGRVARASIPLATWAVITIQHQGGNLRRRINGGAWSSVSCGNLPSVAGSPIDFCRAPPVRDVDIAQHCLYNTSRSDAEILEVERYFGQKVGVVV